VKHKPKGKPKQGGRFAALRDELANKTSDKMVAK
jgi:hypothetical protein